MANYPQWVPADSDTITLSSNYPNATVSVTGIGVPWTTTTTTDTGITVGPWNQPTSTKIRLDGPEADIEINGESMIDMLRRIEQRLNILTPNPKLESEWEELRALGDQYRKLEAQIQAKMKTWELLNK